LKTSKPARAKVLRIDGAPLAIAGIASGRARIIALLESLPDDEILTAPMVARRVGLCLRGVQNMESALTDVAMAWRVGHKVFWGNRQAIAELRRQLENR